MTQQLLISTEVVDADNDNLPEMAAKVNANFGELYDREIETYAAARLRDDLVLGDKYTVNSRATADDGAAGEFYAVTAGSLTDNDGTVLLTATSGVALKRMYVGKKHLTWFGGKADYVSTSVRGTDNLTFINAAISADKIPDASAFYSSGLSVYLSPGKWYFSDTIELKTQVEIYGDTVAGAGFINGARMYFAEGKTGINVNRYNTLGDAVQGTPTQGADTSTIRHLTLQSLGGTSSGDTPLGGSGINMRARAHIENCYIGGFPLDGIRCAAQAGAGGTAEGNANGFTLFHNRMIGNKRAGIYLTGADANAANVYNCDCTYNGNFGIFDNSFLGNTFSGCHTAANGVYAAGTPYTSVVYHLGNRYTCIKSATQGQYVSTEPGTNTAIWQLIGPGSVHASIPQWSNAVDVGFYQFGAAYYSGNANARSSYVGCYSESGQAPSWVTSPSMVIGGLHGAGVWGTGYVVDGGKSVGGSLRAIPSKDKGHSITPVENDILLRAFISGDQWTSLFQYDTTLKTLKVGAYLGSLSNIQLLGGLASSLNFGRNVAPLRGSVNIGPELYVGYNNSARKIDYKAAVPTTGIYAKGDLILNNNGTTTGPVGWQCTSSTLVDGSEVETTPAVWKTFGAKAAIDANDTIATATGTDATQVNALIAELHDLKDKLRTAGLIAT